MKGVIPMRRRAWPLALLGLTAALSTLALADDGPPAVLADLEPLTQPLPRPLLPVAARASAADGGDCAVPGCLGFDPECRQRVFTAVLACVQQGGIAEVPPPGQGVEVFRAQGSGFVLYGTLGAPGGNHRALLTTLSGLVESAPPPGLMPERTP